MPRGIPSDPNDRHLGPGSRRTRLDGIRVPAAGPVAGSLASAAIGQIALVVTGVITARTLGPTDRGYLALVILIPTVLHVVGSLGLPRATTYFIASDPARETSVLRAIRGPAFLQGAALTVVQVGVFATVLAGEPARVWWAAVAALPLLAANLGDMYGKSILQGQRRYLAFNVVRNGGITFYLIGASLLAADGRAGLIEFAIAYVVSSILAAIVTLAVALRRREASRQPVNVSRGELMRFGLRGYLVTLSPINTFRLDQLVVGLALAPQALGLYVVGLAFTNLPGFVSRSIGMIAFPQVASVRHARGEEMRRFLWFSIAFSGVTVLVLEITAGWLVPLFFGQEFEGAVLLTRILLLAAFLEGARNVLTETTTGSGRPGLGSIAELSSWIVLVPTIALFLPAWEETGVALAATVSAAASVVLLVILVRLSSSTVHQ